MTEIEDWIETGAREAGVVLDRLGSDAGASVVAAAKERFVHGTPRVWWLGLSGPYTQYDSRTQTLSSVLPTTSETVFLIPETDELVLPVYAIFVSDLEKLLAECPYFEYYVVGEKRDWLVVESDHDIFFVCRWAGGPGPGDAGLSKH